MWDSDVWRFDELLARFWFASFRRDVVSATWENVSEGSLFVTLGLAAAGFSGFLTLEGRGGIIDCGNGFFSGVVFGGGDFVGSTGGGGLGTCGGNGGCAASVLRLSETGDVFPVPLFTVTGLGSSTCFLFVPGCVDSEWVCLVPSCTISTLSASQEPVSRSDLAVSDTPCGFTITFSGLPAPIWGLFSGRASTFANLCVG